MKRIHFNLTSVVVIIFVGWMLAACCGKSNITDKSNNFVEVEGTAEQEYAPDEFYLYINIDEADVSKKATVEKLETEMKKALTALGVDVKSDLTVTDMSTSYSYWYNWSRNRNKVVTSKQYILKLKDMKTIESVFQKLEALGIPNISISKVDFSGKEKLENDVRALAVKNAREKAEALVGAVGQKVGKVLYIKEAGDRTMPVEVLYENEARYEVADAANKAEVEPEIALNYNKQKAKATVLARFEIK